MTTNIVPVNAWGANVVVPQDLEPATAASLAVFVQELANRAEYLRQRLPGANPPANLIRLTKTGYNAVFQIGTTVWTQGAFNSGALLYNVVNAAQEFYIPLDLVPGQIVRGYGMYVNGGSAHAGIPATKPKIDLVKSFTTYPASVGTTNLPQMSALDTTTDPTAVLATYNVVHAVSSGAVAFTVASGDSWALRVYGEGGANSLPSVTSIAGFYVDISGA